MPKPFCVIRAYGMRHCMWKISLWWEAITPITHSLGVVKLGLSTCQATRYIHAQTYHPLNSLYFYWFFVKKSISVLCWCVQLPYLVLVCSVCFGMCIYWPWLYQNGLECTRYADAMDLPFLFIQQNIRRDLEHSRVYFEPVPMPPTLRVIGSTSWHQRMQKCTCCWYFYLP